MTIAPKKKSSAKTGERCSSRQSGHSSPDQSDETDYGQKSRSGDSATASALALRSRLTKHAGCRPVHENAVKSKKSAKHEKPAKHEHKKEKENEKEETGCNSDDEYGAGFKDDALEVEFSKRMKEERGFDIVEMEGDGNCMFRAVAHQIYGDQNMHAEIRKFCMEYLSKNRDEFSSFVTEDMTDYIARKRRLDVHGNHLELQVLTEIYARPIEIYEYDTKPLKSFKNRDDRSDAINAPLRLSYHGRSHYNSVIDPFNATIGVGLGLPGLNPGEADRNLLNGALRASESQQIEEAMLKDKMKMSDWERTDEEINQIAMKQSYDQFMNECAKREAAYKMRHGYEHIERRKSKSPEPESNQLNSKAAVPSATETAKQNLLNIPEAPSLVQSSSKPCRSPQYHGVKRGASSPNLPGCSYDSVSTKTRKRVGESFSSLNIDFCEPGPSTSKDVFTKSRPNGEKPQDENSSKDTGLYEELLRAQNFDNDQDLAQVLALSTQEYMESLNKTPTNEK